MSRDPVRRPEIVVDLGAIRRNVRRLRDLVAPDGSDVMVVVKADGYGHGLLEAAYAARRAGAPWLGVATLDEAVRLREAGDTGRILSWLTVPGDGWSAAIEADVDITAYTTGELAAMLGVERADVEADQLAFARRAAREYAATVLLKGHHTLVAAPNGRVRVTTTGTPWLAVAGAGDVLGGLCGALLAAGLTPYDAGAVGSWLHGAAATLASAGGPISAPDVAAAVPRVIASLLA